MYYPFIVIKIVIILVAIAILAGGFYFYRTNAKTDISPQNQNTSSPSANQKSDLVAKTNSISVKNQVGGETIVVGAVNLDKDGFVVIHAVTKDGNAGEVAGHSDLLKKGEIKNIEVLLDQVSKKGESYIAMLHEDTNKDEDFGGETEDMALKDAQGNIVEVKIDITSNAPVTTDTTEEEE